MERRSRPLNMCPRHLLRIFDVIDQNLLFLGPFRTIRWGWRWSSASLFLDKKTYDNSDLSKKDTSVKLRSAESAAGPMAEMPRRGVVDNWP